ncbi:glycosyltransferase family 4 protein [Plebeiibacterium marinum]|uniref:Glycosyltransferase family 4 protein n=1 Tax=Plebeiibacterium marinum TaxID=2992111 RepID=A0AAE3MA58_9BACT|nr:glycosyltransferase family 4 protein [Plebeiobacterium marinum]MCW3804138.1 glycosyltransferase family 4 protein [Plebeiobacterium marinum]
MGAIETKPKRKIVFVNQATGYLTIDVVNTFAKDYDEVALICGSVRVQDVELDSKVDISKISIYDRGNNFRKAFSWALGTLQVFFLLLIKYRKHEVFYYTIPPSAYLLASFFRSSFYIMIYDLYPDALKIRGRSEDRLLYKWWAKQNKKVFQKACKVFTLSNQLKEGVKKYYPNANVEVIHNWSAFSGKLPVDREHNSIIRREGLSGKFVVQYSGNIGVTHNVEVIVELAESLSNNGDIEFLIIGRGERKNVIERLIKERDLGNCKVLPFRKDEELYESLCVPYISIVTLDDRVPDISVPSKVYNILASGVPIMAVASLESSIANLVQTHNIGRTFLKDDIVGMKEFILDLRNNPDKLKAISRNSIEASKEYTNQNAVRIYESCLG